MKNLFYNLLSSSTNSASFRYLEVWLVHVPHLWDLNRTVPATFLYSCPTTLYLQPASSLHNPVWLNSSQGVIKDQPTFSYPYPGSWGTGGPRNHSLCPATKDFEAVCLSARSGEQKHTHHVTVSLEMQKPRLLLGLSCRQPLSETPGLQTLLHKLWLSQLSPALLFSL